MTLRRLAAYPSWLLARSHARSQRLLRAALESEGVRGYHFRVLAALEQYGPSSQAALARATGIDRSDVVATLDDLTTWGYVRRDPDPDDRRRNVVNLTKPGDAALQRLGGVLDDVQNAVLEPLTPTERTTLIRLLTKLTPPSDDDTNGTPCETPAEPHR